MEPILLSDFLKNEKLFSKSYQSISGASFDSRLTKKGDLFFAISGKKTDGHYYLAEASQKGAVAAVVSEKYLGSDFGMELFKTADVAAYLQGLAASLIRCRGPKILAITGSLGKTTTKEFAAALIKDSYPIFFSPKSYNSQITLPICILNATGCEELLILEMSMSEPGHMAALVSIAPPTISMITTIAVQHANHFSEGLLGIAKEKGVIFSHPLTKYGFLQKEAPYFELVSSIGPFEKTTFSLEDPQADYYLKIGDKKFEIYEQKHLVLQLPCLFPIKPFYHNFLCAAILAKAVGLPWDLIAKRAMGLSLPPMRYEQLKFNDITFINDAYNANPDSIKAALEGMPSPQKGGRKIAVLSEMDALGMYCESAHAFVGEIACQHVDYLFCVGQRCEAIGRSWKKERNTFEIFKSKESLKLALKQLVKPGDVVLFKGARSYALETLIEELRV